LETYCQITRLGRYAITSFLIALATSLPELVVSLSSALRGVPALAFGNAVGSNIVNLSLVMGLTAVFAHRLYFNHSTHPRHIYLPLIASLLPFVLAFDGSISRLDGFLLLLEFIIYLYYVFGQTSTSMSSAISWREHLKYIVSPKAIHLLFHLSFWVGILVIASQIIVAQAQNLSNILNLPVSFVGFFLVALGTSLPELVFNLRSVTSHHPGLATANIIGSCLTNSALIVGLTALFKPIVLNPSSLVILPGLEYLFILLLFSLFITTKKRLDAWEAIILILLFIYYSNLEFLFK
jgi:cation:H+ antiporter